MYNVLVYNYIIMLATSYSTGIHVSRISSRFLAVVQQYTMEMIPTKHVERMILIYKSCLTNTDSDDEYW